MKWVLMIAVIVTGALGQWGMIVRYDEGFNAGKCAALREYFGQLGTCEELLKR